MVKILVRIRLFLLAIIGVLVYLAVSVLNVSLWYILGVGIITGIIFGKVFCRWMCPIGLIMEILMGGKSDSSITQMYMYHKVGCPIAWISGWLNRYSLLRIRLNHNTCKTCGICDKKCYIVAMEPNKYSLFKTGKERPGNSYTCSKCLECVAACPNGSLKFK